MIERALPEILLDSALASAIGEIATTFATVEDAEKAALDADLTAPLRTSADWFTLRSLVRSTIDRRGYVVVRGLEADEGRSLLLLAGLFEAPFDPYRPGRIVKRFRMSPWTTELSHTIRAGDFHTDGNVSSNPPFATAMQCELEDPGVPEYAEQRVAFLPDLLARLADGIAEDVRALRFLTEEEAVMAHERTAIVWRGRLVSDHTVRYHPHSLRVADVRLAIGRRDLDSILSSIHQAALHVSIPFHTAAGDTVLVSNRTALHYRGACSVRFTRFPSEFESRSLFVLHLKEPAHG